MPEDNNIDDIEMLDEPGENVSSQGEVTRDQVDDALNDVGSEILQGVGVPEPVADIAAKTGGGPLMPGNLPGSKMVSNMARNKLTQGINAVKNAIAPQDVGEQQEQTDPNGLKEGFGRKEYAKKVGNKDYYKEEGEKLKARLNEARMEKARDWKKKKDPEDGKTDSDTKKTDSGNKTGDKKNIPIVKADGSDTAKKGVVDKAKDAINVGKSKAALVKNKIDAAKAGAYQAAHPVEAAKEQAKVAVRKKLLKVVVSHWWIILIALAAFIIFMVIFLIILGGSGGDENEENTTTTYNEEYDFTLTSVTISNGLSDEDFYTVTLGDFAMGAAYAEMTNSISDLTSEQKSEVYKAYLVYAKAQALNMGNYDASTKSININSDTAGIPYCSIYDGCTVYENNGNYYYAPYSYEDDAYPGFYTRIEPMSDEEKSIITSAQAETKYLLLVPDSINSMITTADYGTIPYSPAVTSKWIDAVKSGKDFKDAIAETSEYANYQIYNHEDMAIQYNYASRNTYWWPIGSAQKDSNNLYSGSPTATNITAYFAGNDSVHNGNHGAIDIGAACGSNVIAARDGTVIYTNDGCPTGSLGSKCGGGAGNYVKIDHGDGITTIYMHLTSGTLAVKTGDRVAQGQLLGKSGTSGSSTGCHLHFEMQINGVKTDPLEYVDPNNPRPSGISSVENGYVEGGNVQESVCKTLKNIGFSNNAVAAIMTNIASESSFRLDALGDSGTSYGLCQWHNGRNTNLRNYCGSNLNTTKCQIDFLMTELQGSYTGVYNYLQTNNNAKDMANYYCLHFEVPANKVATCSNRSNNAAGMLNYVNNGCR